MDSKVSGGRSKTIGGVVTFATVVAVVAGLALTLFGIGAPERVLAVHNASSWLWSSAKSEVGRVNGRTGRVDTRVKINGSTSNPVQISQSDRHLIMRDTTTGRVTSLDLATLQASASLDTQAGTGIRVAVHDNKAFIIDAIQGAVRQIEPRLLQPVGDPLRFSPGLVGGVFDTMGQLWVASPADGTVTAITAGAKGPNKVRTAPIGDARHDLVMTVLDKGVAVLDQTAATLVALRGDNNDAAPTARKLPLSKPGALAPRTSGDDIPVTVVDDRQVYVVMSDKVTEFTVPGGAGNLAPAVAWSSRFYIADDSNGTVYVVDRGGAIVDRIVFPGAKGPLELDVRSGRLFINHPQGDTARVVDDKHQVKVVNKYPDDVVGGEQPPKPNPAPPPPPPPPKQPVVSPPGAPTSVVATAGNALARLTWEPAAANNSPIVKYVVEGGPKPIEVGAGQRAVELTGLTNGQTYRFSVYAVNAKGSGPKGMSNPVMPTADVPDAPASVTAVANNDGSVKITWPAADGKGAKIVRYTVTKIEAGAASSAGTTAGTELTIPTGTLTYGQQYAFTVSAINDRGASSAPSPLSNSVTPRTAPGAVKGLSATTVNNQKGAVRVAWQAAQANGSAIRRYLVQANGRSSTVGAETLNTTLTGFGDNETVNVQVRAENEAGQGAPTSATAKTLQKPNVTITGGSSTYDSVTVVFSVSGGPPAGGCKLQITGGGSATGSCSSLKVDGLKPGTDYTATVTAGNAAGTDTATATRKTATLSGTVRCVPPAGDSYCSGGIGIYSRPWQDTSSQTSPQAYNGDRFTAYCKVKGMDGNQSPDAELFASKYNNNKRSDMWVKIKTTERYIPWIWLNLDDGDNLANLPNC